MTSNSIAAAHLHCLQECPTWPCNTITCVDPQSTFNLWSAVFGATGGGGGQGAEALSAAPQHNLGQSEPGVTSTGAPSARYQTRAAARARAGSGRTSAGPTQQASGQVFSSEIEDAYHASLVKLFSSPEGYESIGLPGPPHTIRHNTLGERLETMRILHT